jgi:S-DNA-T family DNA segregation ATPase FtsK/SpoIIIE
MSRSDVKSLPEDALALGLAAEDGKLLPIALDEEFCYTVGGAAGSGKTELLASIARQAKAKGSQLFLFDSEDAELEGLGLFDAVAHNDAELFTLMENTMVPSSASATTW